MIKPAENPKKITGSAPLIQSAEIGLTEQHQDSSAWLTESCRPTSRQIPTGKKLYIVCKNSSDGTDIKATVLKNDDIELAVQLDIPLEISQDEICHVRCDCNDSAWQFDVSVVSCYGNILVLKHSDDIRFTDRRRYSRVSVNKAAFIMRFPFSRMLASNDNEENTEEGLPDVFAKAWKPPEFVPAVVTELGGPGLRIEAPLDVKVGERVVVILKMSEELTLNSARNSRDIPLRQAIEQKEKTTPLRIIENIGEVRRTSLIQDGLAMAVELTGLSDSDVNEIIRETNLLSLKTDANEDFSSAETGRDCRISKSWPAYSLSHEPV